MRHTFLQHSDPESTHHPVALAGKGLAERTVSDQHISAARPPFPVSLSHRLSSPTLYPRTSDTRTHTLRTRTHTFCFRPALDFLRRKHTSPGMVHIPIVSRLSLGDYRSIILTFLILGIETCCRVVAYLIPGFILDAQKALIEKYANPS